MDPPVAPTHRLKLLLREEAGLAAGREVAEDAEGVAGAALVGVDPVFAWAGRTDGQTEGLGEAGGAGPLPPKLGGGVVPKLTVLQVGVAEAQLAADARGALGGAQGPPQLLHLGAQGAERGVNLLQPPVIRGGARHPRGSAAPPPAPARGQRFEGFSWRALGQRGVKSSGCRGVGGGKGIAEPGQEGTEGT